MPDFILDVQGLEAIFKNNVVRAVNDKSLGLASYKIFNVLGESGDRGLATGVIGVPGNGRYSLVFNRAIMPPYTSA